MAQLIDYSVATGGNSGLLNQSALAMSCTHIITIRTSLYEYRVVQIDRI